MITGCSLLLTRQYLSGSGNGRQHWQSLWRDDYYILTAPCHTIGECVDTSVTELFHLVQMLTLYKTVVHLRLPVCKILQTLHQPSVDTVCSYGIYIANDKALQRQMSTAADVQQWHSKRDVYRHLAFRCSFEFTSTDTGTYETKTKTRPPRPRPRFGWFETGLVIK